MSRLKNLLDRKVYFNKRDLQNAILVGFGFGVGSRDLIGFFFVSICWYIGSFITGKFIEMRNS